MGPPIDERLRAAGLPSLPRTAWLEIDLDALVANVAAVREHVGPAVRVEPVVKADAYGHGSVPIALALDAAGVDGLSVATLDEALELRAAGVRAPLLVLYPVPADAVELAAAEGLAVSVGEAGSLARIAAAARSDRGRRLEVQLEVETGLGRGGFAPADVVAAGRSLAAAAGLRWTGTWTHLAAPDDPARTAAQAARFEAALGALGNANLDPGTRHLAASGGILGGAPLLDAVRPGLVTYGIVPEGLQPVPEARALAERLRPVLAVRARPVRVIDLPAGHGVSYGPSFETTRPSRIATLPVGYGDGWPRAASNLGHALVRDVAVPFVGTVAMDAVMVDVTDVPGPPVDPGDEITLLGVPGHGATRGGVAVTATDLARLRNTISWEVVTAMARRMPRVYHAAAGLVGIRTLTSQETAWLGSNSGTATSASSRSTRS